MDTATIPNAGMRYLRHNLEQEAPALLCNAVGPIEALTANCGPLFPAAAATSPAVRFS